MQRTFLVLVGVVGALAISGARADATPALAGPALAQPAIVVADADDRYANPHDVQGVVTSFDRFNMTLRVNGREYPVLLHQGTVIRPRGTTLAPGMVINVAGYWQGGIYYANLINVVRY